MKRWHPLSELPHKKSNHNPLTSEQKQRNANLATERVPVEHGFGWLKRFAILIGPYRNRSKRFVLRLNLIAALYNAHL